MNRIIFTIILCIALSSAHAQKIVRNYHGTPLPEVLKDLSKTADKRISFIYNDLEDFFITKRIRRDKVSDAIREAVGFYPIRIVESDSLIFVECIDSDQSRLVGQLVDSKGKPVAYANIQLLSPKDSTYITGGVSNEAGRFVIPSPIKQVLAKISCVGFKTIIRLYNVTDIGKVSMREAGIMLQAVQVEQKEAVRDGDKVKFYPSKDLKNNAYDGYSALSLLTLPGIDVDAVNKSITKLGAPGLLICLNGRPVDSDEIETINPKDIERIDYYPYYNADYPTAGTVIDFRVKRRDHGGQMYLHASEDLNIVSGNDIADWKTYRKNTEYNVKVSGDYAHFSRPRGTEEETNMMFPSEEITKTTENTPSKTHRNKIGGKLSLLHYIGKKDMFQAAAFLSKSHNEKGNNLVERFSNEVDSRSTTDRTHSDNIATSARLYWKKSFDCGLQFRATMRGSYTRNNNNRDYMTVQSILSKTKEDYYALNPSISINMPWKKHTFSLKSIYYYDNSEITYIENANSDGSTLKFGQLIIDLVDNIRLSKKLQLSIDLQQRFVNVDNSIMSYNKSYFTPKAYFTIEMPKSSQLFLGTAMGVFNPNFNLYDTTVKSIDQYQTLTGNPDLPIRDVWSAYYHFYMQRNWGYLQLFGMYEHSSDAIYQTTTYDPQANVFWHSFLSGGKKEDLGINANGQLNIIPKKLKFVAGLTYKHKTEHGVPRNTVDFLWQTYELTYIAKKFNVQLSYTSESKYIDLGKTITMPASLRFSAGYNHKGLNLNFYTKNPFMRCHTKIAYSVDGFNQALRYYEPYKAYNLFNISVSYRFNYGKKHKFNDVDIDTQSKSAIL